MTAYTIEQYKNAARKAKAAGNLTAAEELAQAGIALQNQGQQTPAKPTGDTSMGTAFKVGDAGAVAAATAGSSVLNRQLENSAVGRFFRNAQETIGNPVRSLVGADPIDPNAVQNRLDKAADASSEYLEQLQKDLNFQNLETSDIKDLGSFVNYVGQKAAQAAPYMGSALASGGFLTVPFGVGEVDRNLDEIEGLDRQTQDNIATAGGLIMAALETLGIAKLLPKGTSNKILGGIVEGVITEGVTEGMQELVAIGSEAVAGKEFAEGEILNRLKESAAAGAVAGGSFKGGLTTGVKVKSLFTGDGRLISEGDLSNLPESEKFAAADVARLIDETSKANGYKLKNVDPSSSQGAKQALEDVRSSNVQAINDLKKVLKKQLDPKNAQSLDQLLSVYSEASAGIGAGKKKVSQKVTEKQIQAIQQLVGNTKEGQQLVQELVKSNVITDLFKGGMKGGVSQFTDLFNPLSHSGAVYDPTRYANVFIGGTSAYGTGGASLGVAAGGRVVDFFTGRRSKVAKFVKSNKKALGLPDAEGTSIIEQKAKQKAEAKDRRIALAKIAQLTNAPSSDYLANILSGTGLDRNGLNTVLNDMGEQFGSDPAFKSIIDDVIAQLEGEGTDFLDVLTEFIPVVGHHAQLYFPDLVVSAPDNLLLKRSFDSPNVQTDMPNMGGGSSQFGEQLTTPENYRRGIQDNLDFVRTLQDGAGKDKNLTRVDRGRLITSLENLTNNLGSNPVETVQTEVKKLQDQGVNQDAIDTYVKPYVDRVVRQQRPKGLQAAADAGVVPETDTDTDLLSVVQRAMKATDVPNADDAINPNIPLPKFEKTAALSPDTPVVHKQIKDPSGKTAYGLLPHLRTETKSFREGKPLFTLKTTNQNAEPQIKAIDEVLSRHPDPASSSEAWGAMLGDAFASKDIPVQPNGFIEDLNNGGAQELLSSLTPGQIADADHGFRNAEEFRRAYTNGEIGVEDTGRLFLWSFLSKGVSPYAQEGLFMDSFNGIDPWIKMAADGSLKDNMDGYKKWASTTAPKGSGQPGAGAMHNLNAFGKDFLLKMSQDAGKGDGRSRLQVIHDMMSDPNTTGKEIRREFMRLGEGVGIDNKVVSFTLLVAGYPDVMVLDRVQMRQMWNDGRFTGLNLYDGYKHNGDVVNGSGMALTSTGARGLLVYEAMEKSLQNRLNQIYSDVGRPDAASVGRYHWETWVASSQQEASHGTIDAILARAKGDPNPLEGVTAKEGEYGAYAYGAKYGLENGVPMFTYDVPDRGTYKFTVPEFQSFLNDIKRKAKNNKVIPFGFSVQKSGNAPWYTREGVDLDALAEKAKQYGKQVSTTDEGVRQGQAVPDGRNTDASVGRADEQRLPVLTDRSNANRGRSSATGVYANPLPKTNLRKIKEYIVKSRPAYQVGLKGGKLEDGIQDIEAALEVANSLGMTVRLFNSIDEMNDARREGGLPESANSAGTFYRAMTNFNTGGVYEVDPKAKGFEGTVFALNPGAIVNGEPITELDALTTILHEMSHGMTLGNMQLSELQNQGKSFFNPYSFDFDTAPVGSFARSAILPFIMESSPDVSKGVLKEIQDLQENLDVYTTNNPKERIAVRHIRSMFRRINDYESVGANRDTIVAMEEQALEYLQYTRNIRETSADPVWVYLLNPKLAKKLMPKTTALIRAEFDKAKNPKIQFFNHPFAVVAAVVAAMLAQGQEDEEREKQQQMMPPGALSPQQQMMAPGALTA